MKRNDVLHAWGKDFHWEGTGQMSIKTLIIFFKAVDP